MNFNDELNEANERAGRRLGKTLGVIAKYGMPTIQDAVAACWNGEANPHQQRIVAEFLSAQAGR